MPLSIKDEFLYAELDGRTVKVAKLSKARMLELENLSVKDTVRAVAKCGLL